MFKHLLDADPASNTVSWRWVAGLHTRGKHYLARAQNIRDNTLGRFDPSGRLDETAPPLADDGALMPPMSLEARSDAHEHRVAVLLHDDDLHPESLELRAQCVGCAALRLAPVGDPDGPAARFGNAALHDAMQRAAQHFHTSASVLDASAIADWAKALGVRDILTPYAPTGLTAWALHALREDLAKEGVRLVPVLRGYDARAWPHATAGFFKFREKIPRLIAGLSTP